jgi:hypothetical protein
MNEAIFLPFDCESGGIGDEVCLLSVHFAACDEDWQVVDELDLLVKPNDTDETGSTLYKLTASALSINHIDLIAHDKVAMTYSQAGQVLREFLIKNSQNGKVKLQPMGKNIGGDVDWVTSHLLGKKTFNQYVSYRNYDITGVVTYLKRTGRLDQFAPESLEGLAKFFGIEANWHTARGDNYAGIKVIQRLEDL